MWENQYLSIFREVNEHSSKVVIYNFTAFYSLIQIHIFTYWKEVEVETDNQNE